ncbi:hypothetical protein EDC30_102187 [Paucimonas lemoignei]|uniref:Uncharacterized protein n=1 Tax=Paucimonas lemoignei TaxID=29443 RepID=A0A4R3HYZ0_PAULE|nr:hypothetical protein EDC30_102187 [Paucimonas lemoignei]
MQDQQCFFREIKKCCFKRACDWREENFSYLLGNLNWEFLMKLAVPIEHGNVLVRFRIAG